MEPNLDLASFIDHTLLKPEATKSDIERLCQEAKQYQFFAVCVNPTYVSLVRKILDGTRIKICTVAGFPLGANLTETKIREAALGISHGAQEIDMVMNISALKSSNEDLVEEDIRSVRQTCGKGIILKVILETAVLTQEEKVRACQIAKRVGADFVKTSTGFGSGGATVADVLLMRKAVGKEMGVKASGGIRDYQMAIKLIEAGATRIGTSSGVKIMKEWLSH
ncbi:MAG: deoxyribose-phosphate aldolase [Candidatus Edwardsbacteria bacterium]